MRKERCTLGAHVHTHRVATLHPRSARAHPPCHNVAPSARTCAPAATQCGTLGAHVRSYRDARALPPRHNGYDIRACAAFSSGSGEVWRSPADASSRVAWVHCVRRTFLESLLPPAEAGSGPRKRSREPPAEAGGYDLTTGCPPGLRAKRERRECSRELVQTMR